MSLAYGLDTTDLALIALGGGVLLLVIAYIADRRDPAAAGRAAASRVGGGAFSTISAVAKFGVTFVATFWNRLPALPQKIWKGLTAFALYNFHRAAGGDRIGLEVTPSGKVRLTPVKWMGPEQVGEEEMPGWRAKGRDKTWEPTTLGQSGPRLGKTPIVPLDSDSWKSTSVLEARVAEAVDQGDHRPLYRVDEAKLTATLEADPGPAAGTAPVADGGTTVANVKFDPRTSPIFEDYIIDLGSDDYDGMAVSFNKAKELLSERATSDEMQAQEERGYLAGRSREDLKRLMWKLFLVAAFVAVMGLIGKELVFVIFGGGGGGGGGGGILPLMGSLL